MGHVIVYSTASKYRSPNSTKDLKRNQPKTAYTAEVIRVLGLDRDLALIEKDGVEKFLSQSYDCGHFRRKKRPRASSGRHVHVCGRRPTFKIGTAKKKKKREKKKKGWDEENG